MSSSSDVVDGHKETLLAPAILLDRALRRLRAVGVAVVLFAGGCGDDQSITPLPCDVDAVLQDKCRMCHSAELAFGAPMPLLSWEDIQRPSPSDDSIAVWQQMQTRIQDNQRPMPPAGLPALTEVQRASLGAWFKGDAPPGEMDCK